jgi:hypothetical protein
MDMAVYSLLAIILREEETQNKGSGYTITAANWARE